MYVGYKRERGRERERLWVHVGYKRERERERE